ncbi:MAG TPA: GNAT family N-acetyltransferase, partial [Streptosporangiaceae bacterium]
MHIERFDPAADAAKVQACYEIYTACHPVDEPGGPIMTAPVFAGWFSRGWDGSPREAGMAIGDDGACVGCYLLELPDRENKHLGYLAMCVRPDQRRHGYGSALLRYATGRAAGHGRTLLTSETRIGSDGWAFASAAGARAELVEVRRVLELADIPAARRAELRRAAEKAAGGYSLIRWQGPTPDEYLDQVATVLSAMADAPHSPGHEPHQNDAERVRSGESRDREQGVRRYSVAARCDRTGELAGMTQLGVESASPQWGYQFFTAVARAHRGHRLGLWVKVDMLDMLADAEPGLRRIHTGNADLNAHMIAINTELGFRVLHEWQTW